MAGRVTAAGPGRHLLDKIDAREPALAREAEEAQARIDELAARLREVRQEISDLQVTAYPWGMVLGNGIRNWQSRPAGRKTCERARSQHEDKPAPKNRPRDNIIPGQTGCSANSANCNPGD
jgi:hypothetical protein